MSSSFWCCVCAEELQECRLKWVWKYCWQILISPAAYLVFLFTRLFGFSKYVLEILVAFSFFETPDVVTPVQWQRSDLQKCLSPSNTNYWVQSCSFNPPKPYLKWQSCPRLYFKNRKYIKVVSAPAPIINPITRPRQSTHSQFKAPVLGRF